MPQRTRKESKNNCRKRRLGFLHSVSDLSAKFRSVQDRKQSASISLVSTWTNFTSGRALHCSKKNAFQLDMSRFTSRSLPHDHTQRCRGVPAQNLLSRLVRLLGIASKLQQPIPLLSQTHTFTSSGRCSNQLSFTMAECDRRLFSARRGDRVPIKFASQPLRSPTHAESVSVARPI